MCSILISPFGKPSPNQTMWGVNGGRFRLGCVIAKKQRLNIEVGWGGTADDYHVTQSCFPKQAPWQNTPCLWASLSLPVKGSPDEMSHEGTSTQGCGQLITVFGARGLPLNNQPVTLWLWRGHVTQLSTQWHPSWLWCGNDSVRRYVSILWDY